MNVHLIAVKFLGPTNTRGARVKLISHWHNQSVTIPFDYSQSNTLANAVARLEDNGFTIRDTGEMAKCYVVTVREFKPLVAAPKGVPAA